MVARIQTDARQSSDDQFPNEKQTVEQVEHGSPTKRDFRADAIEAENAEHAMTVMEAARAYPMACFWAFIMSFCIVRRLILLCSYRTSLTPFFSV
jgi:hypothetical protein